MTNTKVPKQQKKVSAFSKYELTLAEFPIFNLSKKFNKMDLMTYEDTITGKSGKQVKRKWEVTPAAKYGIGTASTFNTLFDLFQIWKESNFESQYINFGSIYNLLKRKGLAVNKQQYTQIAKDLNCLVGMTITAQNAFWDNEREAYVDMTFHLFETVWLYKDKAKSKQASLPFARIKASDILYGSIKKNSLLTADFDSKFFYSLTPIEQRIALYLSKVLKTKKTYSREMLKLANQIPINAKQAKHIKQEFKKACEGLIEKGFKLLESYEFKKAVDGKTELIVFKRKGILPPSKKTARHPAQGTVKEESEINLLVEDILEVCEDEQSTGFYKKVARLLPQQDIYQAISEVKEVRDLGEIKKNKGAIFTSIIKKYARERGLDL